MHAFATGQFIFFVRWTSSAAFSRQCTDTLSNVLMQCCGTICGESEDGNDALIDQLDLSPGINSHLAACVGFDDVNNNRNEQSKTNRFDCVWLVDSHVCRNYFTIVQWRIKGICLSPSSSFKYKEDKELIFFTCSIISGGKETPSTRNVLHFTPTEIIIQREKKQQLSSSTSLLTGKIDPLFQTDRMGRCLLTTHRAPPATHETNGKRNSIRNGSCVVAAIHLFDLFIIAQWVRIDYIRKSSLRARRRWRVFVPFFLLLERKEVSSERERDVRVQPFANRCRAISWRTSMGKPSNAWLDICCTPLSLSNCNRL